MSIAQAGKYAKGRPGFGNIVEGRQYDRGKYPHAYCETRSVPGPELQNPSIDSPHLPGKSERNRDAGQVQWPNPEGAQLQALVYVRVRSCVRTRA